MVKLRLFYDMICIFLVHNALEGYIYFIISTKIFVYFAYIVLICMFFSALFQQ